MPPAGSIAVAPKSTRQVLRMSDRRRKEVPSNLRRAHRLSIAGTKQIRRPPEPAPFSSTEAVAQRLELLRGLVPPGIGRLKEPQMEAAAADRLFEETAEYILLLRSQVEALKQLLDVVCMDKNIHDDA